MEKWKTQKRLPPVLLLTGQPGIGKKSMSYFLAQWILCEQEPAPCGSCFSCQRTLAGNQVNLIEILTESEEDSLKIDQFRSLKNIAGFSAHENPFRVILIPQ